MHFQNTFHFVSRSELTNSGIINFSSITDSNGRSLQIVLDQTNCFQSIEWPYEKYNLMCPLLRRARKVPDLEILKYIFLLRHTISI